MRSALMSLAMLACGIAATAQTPEVVRSTGPGAWGTVRLVEDKRIGVLDGDEAYTFSLIRSVLVGRDGSIWVAENRPPRVRIYSAEGKLVRVVGREGEGPGEYRQIDGFQLMQDGAVALLDGRIGRITIYESSGEVRTSHRFPVSFFTGDMFTVDAAGNFYVKDRVQRSAPGEFTLDAELAWIKINPSGQVVDSVAIPRGPLAEVQSYGGPYSLRTTSLVAGLSPLGYFVTGNPSRYSFDIHRPGAPLLRVEREHTPVQLTRAERSEWEAMAEYLSKQPIGISMRIVNGRPDTLKGPTVRYTVPASKPAYRTISFDSEGAIWIERYVAAQQRKEPTRSPNRERPPLSWYEPRTFDLFEPSGRFLGTMTAPQNVTLRARRGMMLYGTLVGEFDEQYVVRFRIESAAR
jgi:hypothetical protein